MSIARFGCLFLLVGCGKAQVEEGRDRDQLLRVGWSTLNLSGVTTQVYAPVADAPDGGRPLLIVLHGCSQTPDDLKNNADFEGMAEAFGAVVALPKVPNGGKYAGCWDYYGSSHSRTSGDSGHLLDVAHDLTADASFDIASGRVWISGLSSGGGMAMVMGCLAPDVFSGVGIAAGPTVGTTAFQSTSVKSDVKTGSSVCSTLAGSHAADFATQLASDISGTNDYTVAQGYASLNAQIFAGLYADRAGLSALSSGPFDVTALEGYQPKGSGTLYLDDAGPRVSLISATGMGHAWPGGTGAGGEKSFVASQGVDYAWYLADFFSSNARRTDPTGPVDPPDTTEPPPETTVGGTTAPPGDGCAVDEATDTINGHLSRYTVYPKGYGVADETYVDLLNQFGLNKKFTLYEGTDGAWYVDEADVPGC